MDITIKRIKEVMQEKNYSFFSDDRKNFNLNLIGIRTAQNTVNRFDDWLCMLWNYNKTWNILKFQITTDPGLYWLSNPMNPLGTAIVREGHYQGLWQLGSHKGYRALTQKGDITLIRDFNRDGELNYTSGREDVGNSFGINCHRANANRQSIAIDKWSAGCQVFSDPHDFNVFLGICEQSAKSWGNSFTYTLLHENDFS